MFLLRKELKYCNVDNKFMYLFLVLIYSIKMDVWSSPYIYMFYNEIVGGIEFYDVLVKMSFCDLLFWN